MNGVLGTSVFVAREQDRPLGELPDQGAVSVMTLAELRVGVLVADEGAIRAQRLRTLTRLEALATIGVEDEVAREFAEIVAEQRALERKPRIIDTLIAATARAHRVPLYTQDAGFERIDRLEVVRV